MTSSTKANFANQQKNTIERVVPAVTGVAVVWHYDSGGRNGSLPLILWYWPFPFHSESRTPFLKIIVSSVTVCDRKDFYM